MKMLTIQDIFNLFVQEGIKNDPRGVKEVEKYLQKIRKEYDKQDETEKKYFHEEDLKNPYHDTVIQYGDITKKVKKVIVGIDIQGPEILLVHEYNKLHKSDPIDLMIGHHPEGRALLGIPRLQKSIAPFVAFNTGVPISTAEKVEFSRIREIEYRFAPLNYNRALGFAKMLDIPYMGIHTPADNACHAFFEKSIEENISQLDTVQDIVDMLMTVPEIQMAKLSGGGPRIWSGTPEHRCGKIAVTGITGGTESSKEIYREYAKAGIGTILEMHLSQDHLEEARKAHLNVIVTDHMASDSLGMNLLMDLLENQGIEIIDFSGFTRVSRRTSNNDHKSE